MPGLLLVATTAALDLAPLAVALEAAAGVPVRTAPGLLAPGQPGEGLVVEGAQARGQAVVVVAPIGPDLLNHALLTLAGAREAGLATPAVIVAGSDDVDAREVLEAFALTSVVALADLARPDEPTIAGWGACAWATAEPVVATGAGVALTPYGGWEPRDAPDPRTAGREAIAGVLEEIVRAEGPVLASRAYALLNRAAGSRKLTSVARTPLVASTHRLRQQGAIAVEPAPGQEDEVLRAAGTPEVRVRQLGPRTLDEVPLTEIAELMRRLRAAGAADLPRATLTAYRLVRMTARAEHLLALAEELSAEA